MYVRWESVRFIWSTLMDLWWKLNLCFISDPGHRLLPWTPTGTTPSKNGSQELVTPTQWLIMKRAGATRLFLPKRKCREVWRIRWTNGVGETRFCLSLLPKTLKRNMFKFIFMHRQAHKRTTLLFLHHGLVLHNVNYWLRFFKGSCWCNTTQSFLTQPVSRLQTRCEREGSVIARARSLGVYIHRGSLPARLLFWF